MKIRVAKFWLQPTRSFPDGAPDRAEYDTDYYHMEDCRKYAAEWRQEYECCEPKCINRDCPQHWPLERGAQQ